tara:strand:+ start:2043 stop:3134 length:1092 start_codon:yes stop_codon:yes gene_type:complete
MQHKQIVFLCGARDYHAMDWYNSAKDILPSRKILVLTDLIEGEGFNKIVKEGDAIHKLLILDKFLFKKQSSFGNLWRNLLKIICLPIQVVLLKKFARKFPESIYHAHAMYYLFLAWAANIEYIGTPQGSDVLVRPYKSKLYKLFAIKALKSAKGITVDSVSMKNNIKKLSGVNSVIVQNGIDVKTILVQSPYHVIRDKVLSIRGFTDLYRINEIFQARKSILKELEIHFIYPFHDDSYKERIAKNFNKVDKDYGRVTRNEMYELLHSSKLVISIPKSDSSPRSVYEAIFCGCSVAVTYNPYLDILPKCMKARIIVVDLDNENWLKEAIKQSEKITAIKYYPSEQAIKIFDQKESLKTISNLFY